MYIHAIFFILLYNIKNNKKNDEICLFFKNYLFFKNVYFLKNDEVTDNIFFIFFHIMKKKNLL